MKLLAHELRMLAAELHRAGDAISAIADGHDDAIELRFPNDSVVAELHDVLRRLDA